MLQEGLSCFIPQKLHYFSRDTDTQESPLGPAHAAAAAEKTLTEITQIPGWKPPECLSAGLFEAFPPWLQVWEQN